MRLRLLLLSIPIAAGLLLMGCKKKNNNTDKPEPEPTPSPLPTVKTSSVDSISDITALGGGVVNSEGTSAITAVGICWDTDHSPTTLKQHTNDGAGTGSYKSHIKGLKANTTYYVRAYATNASGTAYGDEISFKTQPLWTQIYYSTFVTFGTMVCKENVIIMSFFSSNSSILVTHDGGDNWVSVGNGLPNSMMSSLASKGNVVFGSSQSGMYTSTNEGVDWSPSNTGITTNDIRKVVAGPSAVYAATGDMGVFMSTNNGSSWSPISTGITDYNMTDLAVNNTTLYAGTQSDGVFISANNGTSWAAINNGLTDLRVTSLAQNNGKLFMSGYAGNFVSSDNGNSWTKLTSLGTGAHKFYAEGDYLFASGYTDGLLLSRDNGLTWIPINQGIKNGGYVNGLVMNSTYIYITVGNTVYRRVKE